MIGVPLMHEGEPIGVIGLSRSRVDPFVQREIDLVTTFADQAVIAIENVRLFEEVQARSRELTELLERQTATSEVLEVISRSPGNLQLVLEAMLEKAVRICDAKFGNIYRWDGELLHLLAAHNTPPALVEARRQSGIRATSFTRRMVETNTAVHVADLAADEAYTVERDPTEISGVELGGVRTLLIVPMLKENELIGSFSLYRQEVRPFTDKQIELVKNFAAQAVIAIENARLLNELRQRTDDLTELLEQQTATSEVLRVISSSPGELKPVFSAMLESATRICEATFGSMLLRDGDGYRRAAMHNGSQKFSEYGNQTPVFTRGTAPTVDRVIDTRQALHVFDMAAEDPNEPIAKFGGARTLLVVPMLKENEAIGVIGIYRQEVRPFSDKQIELVTNFAAQAVIAIENARLLNELRQRTDDLSGALEQQTATSEVLQVISSSPGELEPVFQSLLQNATRVCHANFGNLALCEGDGFRNVAIHNAVPALDELFRGQLLHPHPESPLSLAARHKRPWHIVDLRATPPYLAGNKPIVMLADVGGARTFLCVPMLKESEVAGVIILYRNEVRPFTDKQIELVQNFAAQAVIAIENTRLLNELRESLQQQTATADVLKVISRSAFDLHAVLDTLLHSAGRLCDADMGVIAQRKGERFYRVVGFGLPSQFIDLVKDQPVELSRNSGSGRALLEGKVIHIEDMEADFGLYLCAGAAGRFSHIARGSHVAGWRASRRADADAHDYASLYRTADRAGHHLCRPGGNCNRERTPVRGRAAAHARTAPAHR